jgi:hypothetical protein
MKGKAFKIQWYYIVALMFIYVICSEMLKTEAFLDAALYPDTPWYLTNGFLVPAIISLFVVGPILILIYKKEIIPLTSG